MRGAGPTLGPHRGRFAYRVVFSALVARIMSVLIGGVIAFLRAGPTGALSAWVATAPLAFAVAFPTSLFVMPPVQRLVDRLFARVG